MDVPREEGRVVAVGGGLAAVRLAGGDRIAKLRRRLGIAPVVGDRVVVGLEPDGGAHVDELLQRRTWLRRLQLMRTGEIVGDQTLLANADRLVVVASVADPPLRRGLVDRLLVAAWDGGLEPVLVLTKADLQDRADEPPAEVMRDYAGLVAGTVLVDARAPEAGEAVAALLGDGVAAFVGHSGVGKSTLVNGLTGGAQATGAISEVTSKGRHTTTTARWLDRPDGRALIDMPGIRSFAPTGFDAHDLAEAFPEIAALRSRCRFDDCLHVGEAGCAVAGAVPAARLASYRKLLEELREHEDAARGYA